MNVFLKILPGAFFAVFVMLLSCQKSQSSTHISQTEVAKVVPSSSDMYHDLGVAADEGTATITSQAQHYETSTMTTDTSTNNLVYHYRSEPFFEGNEVVEIEVCENGNSCSNPEQVTLKIQVTN